MYRIICLLMTLCSSLASDVTVYRISDYDTVDPQKLKPVAVCQFPWEFAYVAGDVLLLHMKIFISNKSPSVTALNVTLTTDDGTFEMLKNTRTNGQRKGQEYYFTSNTAHTVNTTEIQIQLNLYSSNIVCPPFRIAKGRKVKEITKDPLQKECSYYNNCGMYGCAVVVDLENKCVGPPLITRTTIKPVTDVVNSNNKTSTTNVLKTSLHENIDTTTVNNAANATSPPLITRTTIKPVTDVVNSNNKTSTTNVLKTSLHENIDTTTVNNAANATSADHTDSTIIIIAVISSICGTLLFLLFILAIRKRCWRTRSPSGTPQLPPYEPFYLNMLFRRECDQEITEIDQQYEEIIPRVTEGS